MKSKGHQCQDCRFFLLRRMGLAKKYVGECTWMAPIKLPISLGRRRVTATMGGKCPVFIIKEAM